MTAKHRRESDESPAPVTEGRHQVEALGRRQYFSVLRDGPTLFSLAVFVCALLYHIQFVLKYSFPIPYWDEVEFIPYLTGVLPVTFKWLWSPSNEHRIVLTRLICLVVGKLTGINAVAMNLVTLAILAITAAVGVLTMRRLRGKLTYADAFFPLLFLNLGHWANTTWPLMVGPVLSTGLACWTTCLILCIDAFPRRTALYLMGAMILAMAACGSHGLPAAILFSVILSWKGVDAWREGKVRDAYVAFGFVAASILYTGLYFVGHPGVQIEIRRPFTWKACFEEMFKALSMTAGPYGGVLWPYSGYFVFVLTCTALLVLSRDFVRRSDVRIQEAGLLGSIVAVLGTAFSIGYGRNVLGPGAGLEPRYTTFMAPLIFTVYLALSLLKRTSLQEFGQIGVFTLACLFLIPNSQSMGDLEAKREDAARLENDVRSGLPIRTLSEKYGPRWMFTPDIFEVNMRMLADARMSIYRKHPPPEPSVESLYRLSQRTEVKGPSTSGMLAKAEDFGLSPAGTILIAHAPHRCSLPVDTPFRHLSFQFGILPGNITTGVKFQVSVREATGTATPLWSRVLDPIHRPGDQGIQQIQVPVNLSIPPGADLVFETLPWPGNNNFGAWSFWGGVRLEN